VVAQENWGKAFSPNVGWVGDAYANFGIFGVVFSGVMLGAILKFGDRITDESVQPGLAEGLIVGPTLALCSSGLGPVLLTHGLVIALIMLWMLKSKKFPQNDIGSTAHIEGVIANHI
jgi:hypothetical protein